MSTPKLLERCMCAYPNPIMRPLGLIGLNIGSPKTRLTDISKTFTFAESTPSSEVGTLVEEGFWTCNMKMSIDVLSSRGVFPSSSVRVSTEDLGFVEGIPILPDAMAELGLIKRLRDYGVITEITISDIKTELEGKALGTQQLVSWIF